MAKKKRSAKASPGPAKDPRANDVDYDPPPSDEEESKTPNPWPSPGKSAKICCPPARRPMASSHVATGQSSSHSRSCGCQPHGLQQLEAAQSGYGNAGVYVTITMQWDGLLVHGERKGGMSPVSKKHMCLSFFSTCFSLFSTAKHTRYSRQISTTSIKNLPTKKRGCGSQRASRNICTCSYLVPEKRAKPPLYSHTVRGLKDVTRT